MFSRPFVSPAELQCLFFQESVASSFSSWILSASSGYRPSFQSMDYTLRVRKYHLVIDPPDDPLFVPDPDFIGEQE